VAEEPDSGPCVAATVGGLSSTTRLLPVSATKTSPAASTATPTGEAKLKPEPMVLVPPSCRNSSMALLPASATKTSPAASTATPAGWLKPEAMVLVPPLVSTSSTLLYKTLETKTSPAASTATPNGLPMPEVTVTVKPPGATALRALLPGSAAKTLPDPSTATPVGPLKPEPMVWRKAPLGRNSSTAWLPVSATKTSPDPSTATPCGPLKPEPMVVATVSGKEDSVEYWKRAVVLEPLGLTVALSVAPVAERALAASVTTVGGGADGVTRSSRTKSSGRKEGGRFFARRLREPEKVAASVTPNHFFNNERLSGFMVHAPLFPSEPPRRCRAGAGVTGRRGSAGRVSSQVSEPLFFASERRGLRPLDPSGS
jgi:hypothetical protein